MFARAVTDALNAAKVVPPDLPLAAAVMVVVGNKDEPAPLGGAINYDRIKNAWETDVEMQSGVISVTEVSSHG